MSGDLQHKPTRDEVWKQFEKLEVSRKFKKCDRTVRLLEFLVKRSLNGGKSDEREVGVKVWGYEEDWITQSNSNVRTGRTHLMQYLAEYYAEEGREDLVIIDTPDGTIYRAIWHYNPHSRSQWLLEYGLKASRRMFLGLGSVDLPEAHQWPKELKPRRDDLKTEDVFDRAIWYDGNNDAAVIGKAEASYISALFINNPMKVMRSWREGALFDVSIGWRGEVLGAVYEAARGNWQFAYKRWNEAVKIRKPEEMDDVLSLLFLSATDVELAQSVCEKRAQGSDGLERTMLGFLAYLSRTYEEALEHLNQALAIAEANNVANHMANLVKGLVLIAQGATGEAFRALASCFERWDIRGFAAMALEGMEGENLARCLTESDAPHASSLQRALGELRLGQRRSAVNELERGLELGDVWMWFLDRWPMLEGLREDEKFQEILERESSHKSRG